MCGALACLVARVAAGGGSIVQTAHQVRYLRGHGECGAQQRSVNACGIKEWALDCGARVEDVEVAGLFIAKARCVSRREWEKGGGGP